MPCRFVFAEMLVLFINPASHCIRAGADNYVQPIRFLEANKAAHALIFLLPCPFCIFCDQVAFLLYIPCHTLVVQLIEND